MFKQEGVRFFNMKRTLKIEMKKNKTGLKAVKTNKPRTLPDPSYSLIGMY